MPQLLVRQGDITSYTGDAIVNAANNHLVLGSGVAGAIRAAGGPSIQAECTRHGRINVGEAAITGAGDLLVRYVIHAAAMGDEPASARSIQESTAASLVLAVGHDVKRIAFPVLGAGVAGFPFAESATIMRDTIFGSPDASAIDEIVFYGFLPQQAKLLERSLLQ